MPRLSRIAVHPVKALDAADRERVAITPHGGLAGDRQYAILDADGEYVNGKRTAAVHPLRADFDGDLATVRLDVHGEEESRRFHLEDDRAALDTWLSAHFGEPVRVERADGPAMTDSGDPGPTLLSRATLEELASWFPGIDPEGMRRRLRPNLVVEGVPAFWEDRLIGSRFRIGDVALEGTGPIPRCVVPTRDPDTGEEYEGFRETFVRNREATFPDWADPDDFGGYYAAMIGTSVPEPEREGELAVGDEVATEGG